MYTPQQRLEIYEKILPYFNGEERLKDRWLGVEDITCMCFAIQEITQSFPYKLTGFPELSNPEIDPCKTYFPEVEKGIDKKRTAYIKKAIRTVKKLIP